MTIKPDTNVSGTLVIILAAIAICCLAGAIFCEVYGVDASKVWDGFSASLAALVAIHVPPPR